MDLALTHQRCWTHPAREAAARCPACTRFFCRECVTEHDGRLLCAGCLRESVKPAGPSKSRPRIVATFARSAQLAAGISLAWLFFFAVGHALLRLPTQFHEGSLWMSHFLAPDALDPSDDDEP